MLKSSGELFCFILVLQLFDLLVEETETPQFYDFRISGRVPEPPNQYYFLWRPQDTSRNQRAIPIPFSKKYFGEFKILDIQNNENVGKHGHREMMKIRLLKSWRSWILDQYQSKNMKLIFDDMGSLNLPNFETSKPINFGTLEPRNQETWKPRNCETKKPITKKPTNKNPRNKKPRNQ